MEPRPPRKLIQLSNRFARISSHRRGSCMNSTGIQENSGPAELLESVVSALPYRVAVLDCRGVVLHASVPWIRAARESADPLLAGLIPGADCFAAWTNAAVSARL